LILQAGLVFAARFWLHSAPPDDRPHAHHGARRWPQL